MLKLLANKAKLLHLAKLLFSKTAILKLFILGLVLNAQGKR